MLAAQQPPPTMTLQQQQQQAARDIVANIHLIHNCARQYGTVLDKIQPFTSNRVSDSWDNLQRAAGNFAMWYANNQPIILATFGPKIAIEVANDWTTLYINARYYLEGENEVVLNQAMDIISYIILPIQYSGGYIPSGKDSSWKALEGVKNAYVVPKFGKNFPVGEWNKVLLECCRIGNDAWFQEAVKAIKTICKVPATTSTNEILVRVGLVPAGREVNDGGERWCRKEPITVATYPTLINQLPLHRPLQTLSRIVGIKRDNPTDNAKLELKMASREFRVVVDLSGTHKAVVDKLQAATKVGGWGLKSITKSSWDSLAFYMNKGLQVMISGSSKTSFVVFVTYKGVDGDLYWNGGLFGCIGRDIGGNQGQFVAPAQYLIHFGFTLEYNNAKFSYIS
ncbi:hypothetical protein HDU76_013087 [Blyttiomyces sp. JEL0837]|nr:hypothetical protein HDU76_013087 [Blyttiomyces sp. JEL0837]